MRTTGATQLRESTKLMQCVAEKCRVAAGLGCQTALGALQVRACVERVCANVWVRAWVCECTVFKCHKRHTNELPFLKVKALALWQFKLM